MQARVRDCVRERMQRARAGIRTVGGTAAAAFACLLACAGSPQRVDAQTPLASTGGRWIEAGAFHHAVSDGYGDWNGVFTRAVVPVGTRDIFYGDAVTQRAFRERGSYVALANRHEWGAGVFTLVGGGHGFDARLFPEWRADASAGARVGTRRNIVGTIGGSYVQSRDVYRDYAATGSLAVYLTGLVIEAGTRYNTSTPGDVHALRGYTAFTIVPSPRRSIALRVGAGEEGYQLLGGATVLQRFTSQEASIAWRERAGAQWGVVVQADAYRNPYYTRAGGALGVARYF